MIQTPTDTDMEEQRFFYIAFLLTPFGTGKIIRTVTGFPYNHTGISFSPEMKYFYSFARYYKKAPFYAGFVKESVLRYNNNGKIAKIKVCAVPVSEENYNNAKKHIEDIKEHSGEYIYNLISVITFPFRKSVKIKKSYTCIEFVLSMLRKFSELPEIKNEKFLSIKEFCEILEPYTVYEGSIEKFFGGADWEGDPFTEEKSGAFLFKKTVSRNAKLIKRFIKK